MAVDIRVRVSSLNMDSIVLHLNKKIPLGGIPAFADIIIYDSHSGIEPWSVVYSLFTYGTTTATSYLGDMCLPDNLKIVGGSIHVDAMTPLHDLKVNRWRLFEKCL